MPEIGTHQAWTYLFHNWKLFIPHQRSYAQGQKLDCKHKYVVSPSRNLESVWVSHYRPKSPPETRKFLGCPDLGCEFGPRISGTRPSLQLLSTLWHFLGWFLDGYALSLAWAFFPCQLECESLTCPNLGGIPPDPLWRLLRPVDQWRRSRLVFMEWSFGVFFVDADLLSLLKGSCWDWDPTRTPWSDWWKWPLFLWCSSETDEPKFGPLSVGMWSKLWQIATMTKTMNPINWKALIINAIHPFWSGKGKNNSLYWFVFQLWALLNTRC